MVGSMGRLPLFVLPAVLFPGAALPLHVFEPRYRRLVARCIEGDGRFGAVYHDVESLGPFLIEEGRVGCIARITKFTPLPDGRSMVETRGVERFRIRDGIESGAPYYEALVEEYGDVTDATAFIVARRKRSIDLFREVVDLAVDPSVPRPALDPARETSFPLAERLQAEVIWRQALLESRSEFERLDRVDALLRAYLARYESGPGA